MALNQTRSQPSSLDTTHQTPPITNTTATTIDSHQSDPEKSADDSPTYHADSWYGWLVVLAGCIQVMLTLGVTRAHGVYQEHYKDHEYPDTSITTISWIGTIQNTMLNFCGVAVGILSQSYDTRILSAVGTIIMSAAFLAASFSTHVWQLALTQGALFGVAASFPYILGVTVPLQWIERRRGLAVGIVYMGAGIGGMWVSVLTETCLRTVGRPWANRIVAGVMLLVGLSTSGLIKPRVARGKATRALDTSVLKEWRFLMIAGAGVLALGPNTVPFLFMPTYAVEVLKKSSRLAEFAVTVINVSGLFGRMLAGVLSDYLGPVNVLVVWLGLAAVSQLAIWLPFTSTRALVAAAVLFGVTGSSLVGMFLNALAMFYGVARITYISGFVYMGYSVASLVVAQTASLMLDKVGGGKNYSSLIIYSGVLLAAASLVMLAMRLTLSRQLWVRI